MKELFWNYLYIVIVELKRATLVANVERIQTTMVRGNIREYRFMIANSGGGETGEIRVTPPKAEMVIVGYI